MDINEKERKSEESFLEWLNRHKIPFLYIDQTPKTFSAALRQHTTRRPDFMIFIRHIGWILVDVEFKGVPGNFSNFAVDEDETLRYCELQKLYNLQVWYVFSHSKDHFKIWHWIPAQDVLLHELKKSKIGPFRAVPLDACVQVSGTDGIERVLAEMSKFK